jgi:hypothetical protein
MNVPLLAIQSLQGAITARQSEKLPKQLVPAIIKSTTQGRQKKDSMSTAHIKRQHQEAYPDDATLGQVRAARDQQSMAPSVAQPKRQKQSPGGQNASRNHQKQVSSRWASYP